MFFEFVILMRDERCNFKNLTLPKTLIVSLLKQVIKVKSFQNLELSKKHSNSFTKNKEWSLLQGKFAQILLSIERVIF